MAAAMAPASPDDCPSVTRKPALTLVHSDGQPAMTDRLLIIDDDDDLLVACREIAQRTGYDVAATSEPGEFWSAVETWSPTLILVDLRMPKCDGIEILRGLSERRACAPVVLWSGTDGALLENAVRIGTERGLAMSEPLPKPLDPERFRTVLRRFRTAATSITVDELRQAIARREMTLAYQPKIDLRTNHPVGVEALVRWQTPARGSVLPGEFIPLAEQSGLIDDLTQLVLDMALGQMAAWRRNDVTPSVAVNVSPINLKSLSFPDEICAKCDAAGVDRASLMLEVTETAAHDDPTMLLDILTRLRLRNFKLSIDDFGTGHSSLMKLHRLPFSEMKLDRSFIAEARTSARALAIIKSTVSLARSLDMTVVAEGVEDAETAALLRETNCDLGQGRYFFSPSPAEIIPAMFGEMAESGGHGVIKNLTRRSGRNQ